MTQTSNIGLKKIDGSENWRQIFDYHNDSADKTDSAVSAVQDGIAIVANGDTHAAVEEGQFVYVRNHSTLAEGLYKAASAIGTNGELTTSNLTADSSGGLNDLQEQITALNSKIANLTSWNNTGSGLGSEKVNVPNTWNEINVLVMIDSNNQRCFTFHIIRGQIATGTYVFRDGYYESNSNYAYVAITLNFKSDLSVDINMYTAKLTGTDYTSDTAFFVKHKNKAS